MRIVQFNTNKNKIRLTIHLHLHLKLPILENSIAAQSQKGTYLWGSAINPKGRPLIMSRSASFAVTHEQSVAMPVASFKLVLLTR